METMYNSFEPLYVEIFSGNTMVAVHSILRGLLKSNSHCLACF